MHERTASHRNIGSSGKAFAPAETLKITDSQSESSDLNSKIEYLHAQNWWCEIHILNINFFDLWLFQGIVMYLLCKGALNIPF